MDFDDRYSQGDAAPTIEQTDNNSNTCRLFKTISIKEQVELDI